MAVGFLVMRAVGSSAHPPDPASLQPPDPQREAEARGRLKHPSVVLGTDQREVVETTIRSVCRYRGWTLHAVNCRSNHVHVVLSAPVVTPARVMNQFNLVFAQS